MATQEVKPAGRIVELKFQITDSDLFFVRASGEVGCRVSLADMIHRSDGRLLEYFTVEPPAPDRVLTAAAAAPSIDTARLVRERDEEALFEFVVSGPCVGATLADVGAVTRAVTAEDGVGYVVADVPPHADAQRAIETVQRRHEGTLLARRERDRTAPEFTISSFRERLAETLTARQLETLQAAYASGYFAWPRERSAEACAEALDITQPTFNEHLRAGQAKLLAMIFDEPGAGDPFQP